MTWEPRNKAESSHDDSEPSTKREPEDDSSSAGGTRDEYRDDACGEKLRPTAPLSATEPQGKFRFALSTESMSRIWEECVKHLPLLSDWAQYKQDRRGFEFGFFVLRQIDTFRRLMLNILSNLFHISYKNVQMQCCFFLWKKVIHHFLTSKYNVFGRKYALQLDLP